MKVDDIHAAESSLNKNYWVIFSIAYGLQARSAFEFGSGAPAVSSWPPWSR